jgi:hypothetical protein
VPRHIYGNDTLDRMEINAGPAALTPEDWEAYRATIVEPNNRPNRPFGAYASRTRKRRHQGMRELVAVGV